MYGKVTIDIIRDAIEYDCPAFLLLVIRTFICQEGLRLFEKRQKFTQSYYARLYFLYASVTRSARNVNLRKKGGYAAAQKIGGPGVRIAWGN